MRGAEGGARVSTPSEVAGLPWGWEETATATGVIHCFEKGALAGERRRGTARKGLEKYFFSTYRQHSSQRMGSFSWGEWLHVRWGKARGKWWQGEEEERGSRNATAGGKGMEKTKDKIIEERAKGMGLRELGDKQGEIMKEKMLLRESTEETQRWKGKIKRKNRGGKQEQIKMEMDRMSQRWRVRKKLGSYRQGKNNF